VKKLLTIFLGLIIAISYTSPLSAADTAYPAIESEAAILMDARTGQVLYEKSMNEQLYPASITKIMTVLLGIENGDLSDTITMSRQAVFSIDKGSSHIALDVGEQIGLEQALMAAMLPSANEASNGVAEYISGSIPEFVNLMNKRAVEAGALHTRFANANGLPNYEHVTTAYDMAMITKEALMNEQFRRIFGTLKYEIPPTNQQPKPRYLYTEHKMLQSGKYKYDGVIGGKTGYTKDAQCTLVTAARRGERELIVVVLKSLGTGVYTDTKTLLDYGFDQFTATPITLPAVTADNLANPQENLKSAQNIFNQLQDFNYTRLLHKNIDVNGIVVDYTAVENPTTKKTQLKADIHLKNQSDLMYANLGSILMDSPPQETNVLQSTLINISLIIAKIIAAIVIVLFALRWFIKLKNKKRKRYGVIDTSIRSGTRVKYSKPKD